MSSQPLASRVAVVTGGAGGIGAAICKALAEAGATVAIGYNSSGEKAGAMLGALPGDGHMALSMPVTDSAALRQAIAAVDKRHSRLDLLVNSAGITRFVPHGDLDALDDALTSSILDVNVRGVIASVRAALPLMRRSGGGAIVNISSIAAVTAMGSNIAYCASKAAVDNLTKSLARALAPEIRVMSVSPGLVDTEFVRGLDQSWRDEQAGRTPPPQAGGPRGSGSRRSRGRDELDLHHRRHPVRGRRQASRLTRSKCPPDSPRSQAPLAGPKS
jgi:3-oxoacyl-[acyl-carrier protein] reductase